MNITDTTHLAFSIYLYKKQDYDCFKYNFSVSSNMNRSIQKFFDSNKFTLDGYTQYSSEQTKFRLIINFFVNNNYNVQRVTNSDYELFKSSLIEYKNELELAKNTLFKYEEITALSIYKLYMNKEIPFYVFYFSIRYLKFKESFITQELIKLKLVNASKLMKFFPNLFDLTYIQKNFIKEVQQRIDLN